MKKIITISIFVVPLGILLLLNLKLDVPFDPKKSFKNAQTKKAPIVVGFTQGKCDRSQFDEAKLVEEFLEKHQLQSQWKEVSVHDGVELLHNKKIHILLGCFKESSHYPKLSFTRPFYKDKVMGVIQGENRLIVNLEKFLKLKDGGTIGRK